jgi:hypothetical protein
MSSSFKIFRRTAARVVLLLCAWSSGLASLQSHGRPIEFSEPTGTNLTANVSELGNKTTKLPGAEGSIFSAHSFNTPIDTPSKLRLLAPLPGSATIQNNSRREREKNWMLMSPDEMMQSLVNREVYKQPRFGASAYDLQQTTSRDRYSLQTSHQNSRTNQLGAYDFRGLSSETNRWSNASDTFSFNDPLAAYAGKRPSRGQLGSDLNANGAYSLSDLFKSGEDRASDALGDRKALADHLEQFRKSADSQTPGANQGLLNPASGNGGFVKFSDPLPGSSFSSVPEKAKSALIPPGARLAPTAPVAPDETSPPPLASSAPPKPKSVLPSSPKRKF